MKNAVKISILCSLLTVALLVVTGCLPNTSGIEPPNDEFIYPTGLAVIDGDGTGDRYLAVANSNFDLNYNSGTMNVANLTTLYQILAELEANSLTSAYYQDKLDWFSDDMEDIYIPEEILIQTESTLKIGAFASDLELTPSGKRAVIPVRGEKAIFVVDIDETPGARVLNCGQDSERRCDADHRVQSNEDWTLPLEPYEVKTLSYGNYTLGFSTHPYDGDVSLFIIDENDVTRPELLSVSGTVTWGASGLAVRPNLEDPMHSDIYVTGRHDPTPRLMIMQVLSDSENGALANPYFNDVGYISIYGEMYDGTDARGLAVTSSGEYAYVITRSPETLLKLDLNDEKVVDMVSLGYASEPSIVTLYEHTGDPDTPDDDNIFAFVLCFQRDELFVLETDMMMQPHVLNTGAGPHAITIDYSMSLVFVANFRESTVSLFDVDADNRLFTYTTVTPSGSDIKARVKIGKPRLPEGHN